MRWHAEILESLKLMDNNFGRSEFETSLRSAELTLFKI
jgi:hypothetical protein